MSEMFVFHKPNSSSTYWLVFAIVFVILALAINVECKKDSGEINQDVYEPPKRVKTIYKLIRAYLLSQLSDIEDLIEAGRTDEYDQNDLKNRIFNTEKRQLKSQGIIERLKNKMEHDLNKYGWDKK